MTTLAWDQLNTRFYEAGLDRGVLYTEEGVGIAWNGLISVNEKSPTNEGSPVYFDGVKYGDAISLGDYSGSLKAYTYPDEFLEFEGIQDAGNGLFIGNQQPKRFGLSYRTRIGNDVDGIDHGYKIHVIYNLIAVPSQKTFQSLSDTSVTEFEWSISAIPETVPGYRPTAHIILDTRKVGSLLLKDLESTLYGDNVTEARIPPLSTLVSFISTWVIIRITDNNDGTWTATGPDELVSMLDATTFQIIQANAVYLDADTYTVSDTTY